MFLLVSGKNIATGPGARVTCIDSFAGGKEHREMDRHRLVTSTKGRFLLNMCSLGPDVVPKVNQYGNDLH